MTPLDYQALVDAYYENLNTNLRHFTGGPGFLETWAHDEDHNRSLLEILDLAHAHKMEGLTLSLTEKVIVELKLDWLKQATSQMGSLELRGQELHFHARISHEQ